MMPSQPLGILLEELEQNFARLAKGGTQLQLRATHTLARQHIAPAKQTSQLLIQLLALMIAERAPATLQLHVHCLRASIAFDFDRRPSLIPADLLQLAEHIGAVLAPSDDALRLEVPRVLATPSYRSFPDQLAFEAASLCGLPLLVVDEDSIHRRDLVTSLMRAGLEIQACTHEDAGLEVALHGNALAALIVHIHRPLSSGLQIVQKLRDAGVSQPLIALTSHAESDDKDLCLRHGCAGHLSRTSPSHSLLQELERIFATKTATPEV